MLTTLLESRHQRTRNVQAQLFSVAAHAGVILLAVVATQRAVTAVVEAAPPDVIYRVPVDPTPPRPSSPTLPVVQLKGFTLVPTLIVIPDALPQIDLTKPLTDPDAYFNARGVPGGSPTGVEPIAAGTGDLTVDQVDVPARLIAGTGRPQYPETLRSAGVGGDVVAQFVIDTIGRADMSTLTIVSSTHDRLTEAVRRALEKARFAPAEFGGRRVRQIVRMPFVFSLKR